MHPPHLMVIGAALHLISQPQAGKAATLGKNPDEKAPDRIAETATARRSLSAAA